MFSKTNFPSTYYMQYIFAQHFNTKYKNSLQMYFVLVNGNLISENVRTQFQFYILFFLNYYHSDQYIAKSTNK